MPSTVPAIFTSPRVAKTLAEFGIFTQVHVSPSWARPKVAVKVMSSGPIADLGMATSSVTRGGLVVDDHGLCSRRSSLRRLIDLTGSPVANEQQVRSTRASPIAGYERRSWLVLPSQQEDTHDDNRGGFDEHPRTR